MMQQSVYLAGVKGPCWFLLLLLITIVGGGRILAPGAWPVLCLCLPSFPSAMHLAWQVPGDVSTDEAEGEAPGLSSRGIFLWEALLTVGQLFIVPPIGARQDLGRLPRGGDIRARPCDDRREGKQLDSGTSHSREDGETGLAG